MGDFKFGNKTLFVTGAARGIGAQTARRMHALGANVSLVGLEPALMEAIVEELGSRAIFFEVDVCDKEAMKLAAKKTAEHFGSVDFVLANAGINFISAVYDSPPEMIERTFDVNLYGVWNTIHSTLPYLVESKGYILSISSMAAITNGAFLGSYSASKAAVDAFSNSLRQEMRLYDVGVGCAYFAAIDTDLVRGGKKLPVNDVLSTMMPKWISNPIPLDVAIDSIIDAFENYTARVFVPKKLKYFYIFRGLIQIQMEKKLAKDPRMLDALKISRDSVESIESQDLTLGSSLLAKD